MKNLLNLLFPGMFAAVIFLGACEKVVYPPIEVPTEVSYSADIQTIWDADGANCINCHVGNLNPVLTPDVSYSELILGEYVDTANPGDSELMIKLYSGSHNTRASEAQKQTILAWITDGAQNN